MEATGVFSSWVTALRKLSCCSLRRISRTRKIVFRTSPVIIAPKKTMPRTRGTTRRQFSTIQPTLRPTARSTRMVPNVMKNAMALLGLTMRILGCRLNHSGSHATRKNRDPLEDRGPKIRSIGRDWLVARGSRSQHFDGRRCSARGDRGILYNLLDRKLFRQLYIPAQALPAQSRDAVPTG